MDEKELYRRLELYRKRKLYEKDPSHKKKISYKKKRTYNILISIFFIVFIEGIFIINLFKSDTDVSVMENRTLTHKPRFDIDNLIEGRYTKKYESYKNDQFIYREKFINIKSSIDSLIMKKDNNNVYKGEDGYLFEGFEKPNEENEKNNIEAINSFMEKHSDINTTFMLIPISSTVLKEKLPKNAPILDEKIYVDEFEKSLDSRINFIYPYDTMRFHKKEYIYYKTDHHWTTLGAYYAYEELCEKLELDKKNLDDYTKVLATDEFYGTLYSKGLFKVKKGDDVYVYINEDEKDESIITYTEEKKKSASFYNTNKLKEKNKYDLFLDGNHPLVEIENVNVNNDKKLLMIKDSYANSFVEFLTPFFSEIVMLDPRYYYNDIEELISEKEFTDIIYLYNSNTFFQDNSLSLVLNN